MSSKLSYLEKYYGGGTTEGDNGDFATTKKRKKKSEKRKKKSSDGEQKGSNMWVVDDQELEDVPPAEEPDEGYTIVHETPSQQHSRGHTNTNKHHDSSEEEDDEIEVPRRGQQQDDSDSQVPPRSRDTRQDSDSESDDNEPPRRRRADSDSSQGSEEEQSGRRQRADSSSDSDMDAKLPRRKADRKGDTEDNDETTRKGQNILTGENAKTVFRDKEGHKVDVEAEMKRRSEEKARKSQLEATAKYDWNVGAAQKKEKLEYAKKLQEAKNQKVSRDPDDEDLEEELKSQYREGDPMAPMLKKKQKTGEQKSASGKPLYKGPPPPPNRFNIRPGYRWDGVDRSNGWEAKVIAKKAESSAKRDQAYQMSSATL
eukprot:gb/GECG01000265.1/.p1 GENE.gb/GECG01000265.1/~~gb/GECG01000265.1/.p1  ORF type:complete len:370 (+),score=95.27 gb/GECG01000265.1/:1-1110(+)